MAGDKTDKDLELQYRKNLMVVASIVLIYSIAGGKMEPYLSLFGAKLQFRSTGLLEYAMVAVMCFFWWQHWLVNFEAKRYLDCDVLNFPLSVSWADSAYRSVRAEAESVMVRNNLMASSDNLCYQNVKLKHVGFVSVTIFGSLKPTNRQPLDRRFEISIYKNPALFAAASYSYRVKWVKWIIKKNVFLNSVLPQILALVSISVYFINVISHSCALR